MALQEIPRIKIDMSYLRYHFTAVEITNYLLKYLLSYLIAIIKMNNSIVLIYFKS